MTNIENLKKTLIRRFNRLLKEFELNAPVIVLKTELQLVSKAAVALDKALTTDNI